MLTLSTAVTRTDSKTSLQVLSPIDRLVAAAVAAEVVATVGNHKPNDRGPKGLYIYMQTNKKRKKEKRKKKKLLE